MTNIDENDRNVYLYCILLTHIDYCFWFEGLSEYVSKWYVFQVLELVLTINKWKEHRKNLTPLPQFVYIGILSTRVLGTLRVVYTKNILHYHYFRKGHCSTSIIKIPQTCVKPRILFSTPIIFLAEAIAIAVHVNVTNTVIHLLICKCNQNINKLFLFKMYYIYYAFTFQP